MRYLTEEDFLVAMRVVQMDLSHTEPSPNYLKEQGFYDWLGAVTIVRQRKFYPRFHDKVSHLLITINKGHFFSNGNKRMALVTALLFMHYNDYRMRSFSRDKYHKLLHNTFPSVHELQDYKNLPHAGFALFNLSLIVAKSGELDMSHDDLKLGVKNFFKQALVKVD